MFFYWDDWNRTRATSHGVSRQEAEFALRHIQSPYPEYRGGGKYCVWGRTAAGRIIQVVFAYTSTERMDFEQMTLDDIVALEAGAGPYVYVIHARDLTGPEKRRFSKRGR